MTTVVRQLRRTTPPDVSTTHTPAVPTGSLAIDNPSQTDGELGGDCTCGRGLVIGTCVVAANRIWFRAFHDSPSAYHLARVTDWACVDCVADAALDVANGVVREQMQEASRKRAEEGYGWTESER